VDLLARLISTVERGLPAVWCAIVETRGSTPQKAGAAMLVFPDATQAGTLGGGCVEEDVKRLALAALADGSGPRVRAFQLNDDFAWADGLICGGRMTVLVHPLADRSGLDYFRRLNDLADRGEGYTEALVIGDGVGLPIGDRYLFDATGLPVAVLAGRPAWDEIKPHLPPLGPCPRPSAHQGVVYLPVAPIITLLVVGAGHVGQAVARLAADVGFRVQVLDDREKFVNRERFPAADRLFVGPIGATLTDIAPRLTPATFALVMTRGHGHDEEALYHLAASRCGYVGMIGSRRKIRLIFDDLTAKGVPADALARVRAPIGFDIGSQTVPEIAVSIVAELIAARNLGTAEAARRTWARGGE
jgi:xanthine dehydrogenase accessory factor